MYNFVGVLLQIKLCFSPVLLPRASTYKWLSADLFPVMTLPSTMLYHHVFSSLKWNGSWCAIVLFSIKKKKKNFYMLYWNENVYSHSSCTYQIENKAEGCSILFTTSPASACPPSPTTPLRLLLSGFEWVFSARQQGLIRLSNVRCVRPPRWGLLLRLTGRSTDAKRENVREKHHPERLHAHQWCVPFISDFRSKEWCHIQVDNVPF